MAIRLEILIPDGDVNRAAVDEHMDALGFSRDSYWKQRVVAVDGKAVIAREPADGSPSCDASVTSVNGSHGQATVTNTPRAGETEAQTAVRRERGKAAPGRARRTKEEIAEDEAADAADAAKGNISTDPENRVGPEDTPEVQEQDAADEAAEVEDNREPEQPLTAEDLKAAMGLYVNKFDIPAAQEDGVNIFVDALGSPPAGNPSWKMSLVAAAGQEALKKAIDAWTKAAAASGRYGS